MQAIRHGLVAGLVIAFTCCSAAAQTATGQLQIGSAPASIAFQQAESTDILAFPEREGVTLASAVEVDYVTPGTHVGASSTPVVIASGTRVASFMLHLDTPGTAYGEASGSITFARPVLGVIVQGARLDATDAILGAPGTSYPSAGSEPLRGFEQGGGYFNDTFTISADHLTVVIDAIAVANASDQMRILLLDEPLDSDQDGLSDESELLIGTDPFNPDTDGDQLLDGTEADLADGTGCPDALDPDSDDDGILDGEEVVLGISPCNADSDGDDCPDGMDPFPADPEGTDEYVAEQLRILASGILSVDLALFDAPNSNAASGRRNALANRASDAANKVNEGTTDEALELLESLRERVDGMTPPRDWIVSSMERDDIASCVSGLILLIECISPTSGP